MQLAHGSGSGGKGQGGSYMLMHPVYEKSYVESIVPSHRPPIKVKPAQPSLLPCSGRQPPRRQHSSAGRPAGSTPAPAASAAASLPHCPPATSSDL